jgi:hypothetical protein
MELEHESTIIGSASKNKFKKNKKIWILMLDDQIRPHSKQAKRKKL